MPGIVGDDSVVAGERDLEPGAERASADSCDNRLAEGLEAS